MFKLTIANFKFQIFNINQKYLKYYSGIPNTV